MNRSIDLNADAGESYGAWTLGDDAHLFPLLSSVNIACGFHAGDPLTMQGSVALAKQHGLGIGAHPSYPDLPGFGRRIMEAAPEQVYADTLYQISALSGMARAAGLPLQHVKAHGALSTRAWTHGPTAAAIAQATRDFDSALPLMVLPATAAGDRGPRPGRAGGAGNLSRTRVSARWPPRSALDAGLEHPRPPGSRPPRRDDGDRGTD